MPTNNSSITSSSTIVKGVSSSFHQKTGKEAMLASLNDYLVEVIAGGQVGGEELDSEKTFYWEFDNPIAPANFPAITTAEVGLFNLGDYAFDGNLIGFDANGKAIKGVKNQTLIEINCWDDLARTASATKNVRNLRDKVVYVLQNAGQIDDDGNRILPRIDLKAIDEVGQPIVGYIWVDPAANAINERFLVDPINQNLRRIKLLVRVFWFELQQ